MLLIYSFDHLGSMGGCNNMLMLKVCKSLQKLLHCKLLQVFGGFISFYFILHHYT